MLFLGNPNWCSLNKYARLSASGAACVPAPRRVGTSWANGKNSHIQQLHLLQVALCPWHINDNAPRWSNVANSSECTKRARVQGEICIGRVQRRHQTRLLIAASLATCKVIFNRRVSSLLLPRAWSKVLNWGGKNWCLSLNRKHCPQGAAVEALFKLIMRNVACYPQPQKIQPWWRVPTGPHVRMMATCVMSVTVQRNRWFVFTHGAMCTKTWMLECSFKVNDRVWWLRSSLMCTYDTSIDLVDMKTMWLAFFYIHIHRHFCFRISLNFLTIIAFSVQEFSWFCVEQVEGT